MDDEAQSPLFQGVGQAERQAGIREHALTSLLNQAARCRNEAD